MKRNLQPVESDRDGFAASFQSEPLKQRRSTRPSLVDAMAGEIASRNSTGEQQGYAHFPNDSGKAGVGASRESEPDPRMLRKIIRLRQLRAEFFDSKLFADPAWDMLLELAVARAENNPISVTSLCIASGVPPTTALRWIDVMTKAGLFERHGDKMDRRRVYITLTDKAINAIEGYFHKYDFVMKKK